MRAVAKEVIRIERDALTALLKKTGAGFEKACKLVLKSKGRVVLMGIGKPGFIAQKVSATLSSTGTPSLFLHPAEALHGDIGRVTTDDVIIAFSNSGETEEIIKLLPIIKKIGAKLVAFTGNVRSSLAQCSDAVVDVGVKKEACPMNLAPTASTTALLAMGDALAVALLKLKGFRPQDFAFFHPGGNLGKRLLLKVQDIMRTGRDHCVVPEKMKLKDVLYRITKAKVGSATVVDKQGFLKGIFTDGDLRRNLKQSEGILEMEVRKVMTSNPTVIDRHKLAAEALELLRRRKIDEVPVVDKENRPVGLLDVQDLLKAGLV